MSQKSALGSVQTFELGGRSLVCWVPNDISATTAILVAHDAQNYLVPAAETWNGRNWGVVEAIESGRLLPDRNGNLPLIASVHLTDTVFRINELAPEDFFAAHPETWANIPPEMTPPNKILTNNKYTDAIALDVVPALCEKFGITRSVDRTAISGSSMGGLATLYAIGRHPEVYGTALAYSTHWPAGRESLVDYLVDALPKDGKHRVYIDSGDLELDSARIKKGG
ncbi:MAG: alpha/beta hydrolase-fold protein [Rhodoluna sp.]